jgi:hypothetical protein
MKVAIEPELVLCSGCGLPPAHCVCHLIDIIIKPKT